MLRVIFHLLCLAPRHWGTRWESYGQSWRVEAPGGLRACTGSGIEVAEPVPVLGAGLPAVLPACSTYASPVRSLAELPWPAARLGAAGGPGLPPAGASPASCSTEGSPRPGLWGTHPLPRRPAWPRCPMATCTHPGAKRRPSIWVCRELFPANAPAPTPGPASWLRGRGAQPHHGTDPSSRSALSHPAAGVQDPRLGAARMGPRGAGRCRGRGEGSVPRQGVTEGGERELVQWSSHTDGSCSSGP